MADGSVTIEVELTKEQLEKGLKSIKNDLTDLEKTSKNIGDKISNVFNNIGNMATNTGKKLTLGLTTPIAALTTAGIKYNAELEKYQTALTTLTGSAEEAAKIMEQIEQDAAKTPFDVAGLTQANQLLISTGLSAEESRDTILALGDAVSATGGGNDELSRMAVNLQQIKNTGKATALDIKQFAYAGIDIYGLLADYTGKTKEEVSEMAISWDDLNGALIKASKKGGRYFGAMEKQSETTNGAISNLKDSFNRFTASLTKTLVPTVKKIINKLTDWLEAFDKLDDSTKENILKIGLLVAAIGPLLTIIGKISNGVGTGVKAINTFVQAIGVASGTITSTSKAVNGLASVFTAMTSPIGLACAAIGLAVAGIAIAVNESNKKVTESFENMGNAASDFYNGIQTAEGYLDSFNTTMFATTAEQQELTSQMDEIQEGITKICRTASEERRDYTQKEIKQLDEYFEKLRELKNREIEIQQQIAGAISQQAVTNAETFQGSLEEYKVQSQEWIATAQQQADRTIEIIEQGTIEEVALLNQRYGEQATMQNEAYAEEYNKIIAQKQEKIDTANEEVAEVLSIYTKGYADRAKQDGDFYEHIEHYNWEQEQELERHNSTIENIKNNSLLTEYNKNQAIEQENYRHNEEEKKIWKDMYKNMSESEAEQLGVWLAMLTNTEMYGGDISEENRRMVDSILSSYDSMPKKTREAMKNAMSPMLQEMQNSQSSLYAKATSIANGILSRLKKAFDIHSPSRETRAIFENVMKGAELGLEDEEKNLYKQVDNVSDRILKGFDISSLYQKMQNAIELETQKISANLTSGSIVNLERNSNIQARLESIDNNKEIQVNSTLNLDGKVVANTVNKVNAKQKLQYGIA